jgi:hypothetical protein
VPALVPFRCACPKCFLRPGVQEPDISLGGVLVCIVEASRPLYEGVRKMIGNQQRRNR